MGVFDLIGTTRRLALRRYSARWLLFWYYGLRGLSLMYLRPLSHSNIGLRFRVFYAWIGSRPCRDAQAHNEQVRRLRAPMMFGWIFTGHQLGASLIAYGAGSFAPRAAATIRPSSSRRAVHYRGGDGALRRP